jgi:propanol-preferring alcohol dehydrogenase
MRAMVLEHPRPVGDSPLALRDAPLPTPAAGQIRVAVRHCGLCHTDLHTVEGELALPKLPLIPGHQIVGLVEARGAGASRFREGDRVGIPWLHRTDGTCRFCREGNENLCDHAEFTGLHVNGGYAEYTVVGEDFAYAIPSAFDDLHAAPLLCAGIIGYRSYRASLAKPSDRLGLFGFGASAHIVLQFARHMGCEVYVFTRGEAHRKMALRLGAAWAGASQDDPGIKLDAAIIFAPLGALVPDALRHLRKGATVALAGITMTQIPALDYALLYHERGLRSVANSTRQDAREFLELAAQVPIHTEVQEFALQEANRALQRLKSGQIDGAGVLTIS